MIRRGLTILELAVGLTVTALAAAIGGASLATLADHRSRERHAAAALARDAAVRRTIVSWLEGAYVADEPGPAFELVDHTHRGRPDDELRLLTSARTPLGDGGVAVRLHVDRDEATPERGLVAELTDWQRGRVRRVELDSSVVSLDARCFTRLLGRPEWMRSWVSAVVLPAGIDLRLAAATTEGLAPLLRLPITVAVEGGR